MAAHRKVLYLFCFLSHSYISDDDCETASACGKKKGQRRGMCACVSVCESLRARESAETSRGRCGRNSNVAPLKNQPLKKAGFDSHERI